ncbi:hypothetical protein ASPTUDRAFT_40155 [Aspergillus tubingensis CBS 134.48]|uniref:Uncharacterized protein n=1 Tax=Aspergillus tubingensis (strain CBS 134.48) TaxID=767770 RepID=A0A1L9NCQ6_ASPTC|nr:hypothetical protein ASPTUDRAFT_40155 [Aspergillus tubingensis CBS 134.48]
MSQEAFNLPTVITGAPGTIHGKYSSSSVLMIQKNIFFGLLLLWLIIFSVPFSLSWALTASAYGGAMSVCCGDKLNPSIRCCC